MKILKYILWIFLFFLFYILLNSWENEKRIIEKSKMSGEIDQISSTDVFTINKIDNNDSFKENREIIVDTELLFAKINPVGGDITYLSLKHYLSDINSLNGIVLFDKSDSKYHFAQSGFFEQLFSSTGINNEFISDKSSYKIVDGDSDLYLNLKFFCKNGLMVNKVYVFKNYSYEITVNFYFQNFGENILLNKVYGFIKNKKKITKNTFLGINTKSYNGYSVYTEEKSYKKVSYNELDNKHFFYSSNGGWIASSDNYFLSAWIPNYYQLYNYSAEKNSDTYILKYFSDKYINIFPGEVKCIDSILFVGPKVKNNLSKIRQGLDLSIDYGIFWPIAAPIFTMLSKIFLIIGNWGVAIIIVTFLIKILFFHLSSISYKSMGDIKKLQPRLEILKDRYKEDKKLLSQAIIDLYRSEKVNPLGGCLPILIQIPVFISLYYVLLESVELRHASFFLWIKDLSSKDPYYILPILMCITMFIQQKLNPPIQDALQAKVVMFMPFLFLFLFLQFPSGLILYWVVNNILSIIQQWMITR